jgi:hypothetical protein
MGCRVLKKNDKKITFAFKGASHKGIDLVGPGSTLDYITAHSDGEVVAVVSHIDYNTSKSGKRTYGNYVKIRHDNGMYTLYAHMKYNSVNVKVGQRVSRGQVIGYMGNTGYSFGAHLHFEVRNENDQYIDPTAFVDADLPAPKMPETAPTPVELKYKVGDRVKINGVYKSSTDSEKIAPAVTVGKITKILEGTKNPYLLEDGNIGWVNDNVIVSIFEEQKNDSIKVGDLVRVKKGARSYKGVILASFVFNNVYEVIELNGDRAVIGKGGVVTTDINIANLYK